MSYQVLARKWRPQQFEDVVGQEHITDVLMNSIKSGRIHHGYIFSGIRGIGKTTTARILAKALNCEHGPTVHPCNQCEFCREITKGYSMDVEEIDGASNRGVDEMRVLQENAGYAPSRSRYKVFIIDEVHMLTIEAFNALLKTLEEPPPNVIFMMATTEPEKIPMTIRSRCQQFKFREGTAEEIMRLLETIAEREQITISEKSLALLVKTAGGSVRDAENLLDQVIGFCGKDVPDEDVRYVLGIPDQRLLDGFLTAIFHGRTARMFALMEELAGHGYNLRLFCMEMLERIRNVIVLKIAREPAAYLHLFDYTRADLERYTKQASLSKLQQVYWILARVEQDIKFSPSPRYILEMALAKMAHTQPLEPIEDIRARLQDLKELIRQQAALTLPETPEHISGEEMSSEASSAAVSSGDLRHLWNLVLQTAREKKPPLAAKIKHAIPVEFSKGRLTVGFHQEAQLSKEYLETPKNANALADMVQELTGRPVRIATTIHNGALSHQAMREHLDKHGGAPAARPDGSSQSPKKTSSYSSSASSQQAAEKGNWQNRSQNKAPRYKRPVQVSVQDIVRLFEGVIEE